MSQKSESRPAKRRVNGILLLDKAIGASSNRVLQQAKRLFNAAKAGHTGALDPLASGLLPICFGDATRVGEFLLGSNKSYLASARLGESSSTGDAEGEVVASAGVPELSLADWQRIAEQFLGDSTQIPPMYSALKHHGKRLYALAREGKSVERPARPIRVESIAVLGIKAATLDISVTVSSGTYIRTLVEDIARQAGTLAYTSALRRTGVGGVSIDQAHTLESLESMTDPDSALQPLDLALTGLASVALGIDEARRFIAGQRLSMGASGTEGPVCVRDPAGQPIGLGRFRPDGVLAPWKVFAGQKITEK